MPVLNSQCYVCGTRLYRKPSLRARGLRAYCSRSCEAEGKRTPLRECDAAGCITLFRPIKPTHRFCSKSCANTNRRGMTYGAGSPPQRRAAVLRGAGWDGRCMVEGCDYERTFDLHRMVAGRDGGCYELGNMFALCPNHHAEVERGLVTLVARSPLVVIATLLGE